MQPAETTKAIIWEDGGAQCMARVSGQDGAAITQASLSSITCKVFDISTSTPDGVVATPTVTISTSVFDTLQTDARWTKDSTGYNFRHSLAASVFATGDHVYRVEYKLAPTSGEAFWLAFELYSKALRTS